MPSPCENNLLLLVTLLPPFMLRQFYRRYYHPIPLILPRAAFPSVRVSDDLDAAGKAFARRFAQVDNLLARQAKVNGDCVVVER